MEGATKHIGLIGGIGPAATDFDYRRLISNFARRQRALELSIVHADTPTLLANLATNNVAAQTAIYLRLTQRLVSAGAGCVAITSIAGNFFCINAFEALSPLPVVNLVTHVSHAMQDRGLRRVGILGTRTVMETRLYGQIQSAQLIPPNAADQDEVHQAYSAKATAGCIKFTLVDCAAIHADAIARFA